MTFEEILDQAIAMLQRRGRVTYRLLKRQFQLDDDTLADLLAELRYAHREAISEDEQGMVWTGGAAALPTLPPAVPQPCQPSVSQEVLAPQADGTPTTPSTPDAERRQLTVMFCDLVDSTTLSSQLDPEDYRDMVRAYQRVCAEVITRFDGHIAQLLGDGLLVYFGYPQAHEDDAQRAIRTGLGILAVLGDLHQELHQAKGLQLALRLGIHTGLVVVGTMGDAGRQEQLALGETPNIAARIQGLAAPNTLVISDATHRLVQGYFACQDLGSQTLRGVPESMRVYHVLGESGATSRLDVAQPRGLTPLVGRESEVTLLLERWDQAKSSQGQVVLLSGDAGIGKSRLVQILKDHVAQEPHVRWDCRSAEYYQNTALFPLTDLFQRLWQFQAEDTPDEKFGKLEHALSQYRLPLEESVQLFAPLLSVPVPEQAYPPLNLSPQRQRQKTLETIVVILLELAERQPVLFILEDLHWTDPTTLEWLHLLIDQTPSASVLVLLTCRPTFQPAWHHRSYITEITLNHLSQAQVEQIVTGVTHGKPLPPEVLVQIIEKTDGVPLFVEEMTKAILESGQFTVVDDHYELTGGWSALTIPATLQDSLMARLDHLISAKGIAQLAAVIGRRFAYELLQAVAQLDAATLQRELGRLVEAELLFQRGVPPQSTYVFKHALIRDSAYESLLRSTRQHYHHRIAHILKTQLPERAEAEPELLAHHYMAAGLNEQAVPYWYTAGQRASERSAHVEAISHLRTGLALLQTLPETCERVQREVEIYTALGASLSATTSYAASAVEQTYTRARHLCEHLDNPRQLFPVLRGLWNYHSMRGAHQTAHAVGTHLLALAQQVQDPAMLIAAHRALGSTLLWLGTFASAHMSLAPGIALHDGQRHHALTFLYGEEAGVICRSLDAWTLCGLGYLDQALMRSVEAVTLAQQIAHPWSLAFALASMAGCHQLRREGCATQDRAEAALRLATEQGFPYWRAVDSLQRGWALVHQGQAQEGIEQLQEGLQAYQATEAEILRPYWLALLADAYGIMGQPAAGLTVLTEALILVDTSSERWYEAELHRLRGALLLQQSLDNQAEAEACFHHALEIARNQQAKSFELRTATSLAKLWQHQDKRQKAHDLLAPVYGWFTEGFDTVDLQEAKSLLDTLA